MSSRLGRQVAEVARLRPYDQSTPEGRSLERRRRAALSVMANLVARVASFGVITLASRLALESMGVERFGVWMTIAGFIALLNFLDFGIGNGLIGPIARADQEDHVTQARLVTMGLAATSIIGLFAGIVLVAGARAIPLDWLFRGLSPANMAETRTALWVFAALLGLSLPLQTVTRMLVGMQRAYVVHLLSIGTSLAMTVVLLVTRHFGLTIVDYVFVTFGSLQCPALLSLCILALEGKVSVRLLRETHFADYRPLFVVGFAFLALQAGALIGWGSDQILVSILRGPADAGVYAIAVRIFMLVSIPLYIMNAPLWAVYANALERGDLPDVRNYLRLSLLGSIVGAGVLCGTIVLIGPAIWQVFSGDRIPYPPTLIVAFALWTVIDCTANALAMFLNGAHIIRPQLITVGVFVLLAIPIKVAVIGQLGIAVIPFVTSGLYLGTLAVVYAVSMRSAIHRTLTLSQVNRSSIQPSIE